MTGVSLFTRIDAQDRNLFMRLVIAEQHSRRVRYLYRPLTYLGGAWITILLCTVPLFFSPNHPAHAAARIGLPLLVISHLIVRIVKRRVGRPRPSASTLTRTLVREPACFSFPSGHAAAAMSVALAYASVFPMLALPLLLIALAVGASRVFLGVHYPGDVIIGQIIAVVTGAVVLSV